MKKLLSLLAVGAVGVMMSGCGITDPNAPANITVTIGAISDMTAGGGGVTAEVTIKSDSAITAMTYEVRNSSGTAVTSDFTITPPLATAYEGKKDATISFTIAAKSGVSTATYTFYVKATASDINDDDTKTFGVTGVSNPLLTVTGSGTVYNLIGPNAGAYDLVNKTNVTSSGSETAKDLKDITSTAAADFSGALSSGNGTLFAVSTDAAYSAATKTSVKTAGDAATLTTTAALRTGDVIVAKLGGSRGYAIIKITGYTPDGASDNVGKLEFEFKFTTGL